jgi:hypothetical protein
MKTFEQLRLFLERVDELKQLRLLREWKSGLQISYQQGQPTRFEFHQPDEEALRSYLLTFRQFFSDDEPVFMYRIHNLCSLNVRSDVVRERLAESRAAWTKAMKTSGLGLEIDELTISPEKAMRLWINGHYFHNDYEKRELLKKFGSIERGFTKQQFLILIGDATIQLLITARLIEESLNAELIEA